ncbi:MAG: iron-containing alcohol dehydrogenase [Candidatus Nanoarchaeia archaeon]
MLRKYLFPEVIYGENARERIALSVKNMGFEKPLVVSDSGLEKAGWVDELIYMLNLDGINSYEIFTGVEINPTEENVKNGVELFKNKGCDGLIALGGGSAIDCAKCIGICATNPGKIFDYKGVDRIIEAIPPLICLPTTSGSAADVSQFAIIRNQKKGIKYAIVSKMLLSDLSLVDPAYLSTLDQENTIFSGLDALSHSIEAMLSTGSSQLTDIYAMRSIELIKKNLPLRIKEPTNLKARNQIHFASMLAGFAFSNASLGIMHAISHSLGGYTNLNHGYINASLLIPCIRFNYERSDNFSRLAESLNTKNEIESITNSIDNILKQVDFIKYPISEIKDEKALSQIASDALNDACMLTNPKDATHKDIINIIKQSFY